MFAPQQHVHLHREKTDTESWGVTYLQLNFQKILWPGSSLNAHYMEDHLDAKIALEVG